MREQRCTKLSLNRRRARMVATARAEALEARCLLTAPAVSFIQGAGYSAAGFRIRPIARTTCSQRVVCAINCFRPAGVSR